MHIYLTYNCQSLIYSLVENMKLVGRKQRTCLSSIIIKRIHQQLDNKIKLFNELFKVMSCKNFVA